MPSIKRYIKAMRPRVGVRRKGTRIKTALKDYFIKGEAGDAAFGEIEFYSIGANSALIAQLQDFVGYYPSIDLEQLSQLPKGTLGYEYAQHMKQHNIQPLEISPDLKEEADRNPFALRYTVTHDLFHILLGFDTSYAGEMGVFGFTVGQNYSKMLKLAELPVMLIICLIAPKQIKQTLANRRRGKTIGKQAKCLLTYPFEDNWSRPIEDVRAELGLVLEDELNREVKNAIAEVETQGRVAV